MLGMAGWRGDTRATPVLGLESPREIPGCLSSFVFLGMSPGGVGCNEDSRTHIGVGACVILRAMGSTSANDL